MSLLAVATMSFPEFSPALFEIDLGFLGFGKFPIRWYALAYIVGLLVGWRYALALAKRPALWGGVSPADKDDIDDLLFYATLGVILGGRIGYILFYQLPFNWAYTMDHPLSLLKIWEGGMSFHGGALGVTIAILLVARQRKLNLLSIGDIAASVIGIGLFIGRCANFINAELYGRHTDSSWGMVFPEGNAGGTPPAYDWAAGHWVYNGQEMPRYPSQLYEAFLEGLLPLAIISVLVWRFRALTRPGLMTGLFLILYGVGRSIAENFREPDSFVAGLPLDLTMGQLLSAPMWLAGAWLIWNALKKPAATAQA
ncbi:MAG: prolipoprotein diacylglyceryl transferase [Alphaproteobacteria bacterium]|nr:prolipoprotein diacylglyceryl transferase [Alphaproteobacteria bacterium]